MQPLLLVAISASLIASPTLRSAVLVSWSTDGLSKAQSVLTELAPTTVHSELDAAINTRLERYNAAPNKGLAAPAAHNGIDDALIGNRWLLTGTIADPAPPTTRADAIAEDRYFTFSVAPGEGKAIALASLSFEISRQANGAPTEFQWAYLLPGAANPVFIGSQALSITDASATPHTLDLEGIPALQSISGSVAFRLYGWGATARPAWAGFSAQHGDSLVLYGEVFSIPESSTYLLFASGLVFAIVYQGRLRRGEKRRTSL